MQKAVSHRLQALFPSPPGCPDDAAQSPANQSFGRGTQCPKNSVMSRHHRSGLCFTAQPGMSCVCLLGQWTVHGDDALRFEILEEEVVVSRMPGLSGAERTTTVVIGTGLPGLAIATELRRRGVDSIIVS